MAARTSTPPPQNPAREENPILSLVLNIAVPSFILHQFSEPHRLGPVWSLVTALSIPLAYGVYDWRRRRECNLFSALGAASVVLTGGLGLIQAGAIWVAIKEASFPLFFAVAILYSVRTRKPLVRTFLMSPQLVDVPAIEHALKKNGKQKAFGELLFRSSLILSASMFLCAALSFAVAMHILRSEPGTAAFNRELGKMMALSFPVAGIPAFAVLLVAFWMLVRGVKKLTGLASDDIFNPR